MKLLGRISCFFTLTTLLLALTACEARQPTAPEEEESAPATETVDTGLSEFGLDVPPEDGDWLIMRLRAEMPHLNPLTASDYYASMVLAPIFERLLDRDPETLEMKPLIAKSWEISEDHLTYTFHMREDVKFSDGVPMTARDVQFTYEKIMDPTVDAPQLRNYYKDIVACDMIDDYTIRFTCDKPYYRHLVIIGLMDIIPEHIYGKGDFNNHPNNRNPIGSGPYMLEKWETGLELILKRNPHSWYKPETGEPHFDKFIYKIITDSNAAFQVLVRGDLDHSGHSGLQPEDWVRRCSKPSFTRKFNRFAYSQPTYRYLGWNMRNPLFKDKMVRRALTMLVNREAIRDELYYGLAEVVTGNFMPGTPEHNPNITPWPFDPAQAQKLLDEAGWDDTDGDGLLDKDGITFRFEAVTSNQSAIAEKTLTLFKEELARVGIELNIRLLEWASLLDRVQKHEFDVTLMGWMMPPDPDPYQVWHSSQNVINGSNHVGFVNAEADKIIEDARVEFDREKRIALYHRFQEIIHEEQPYTFLVSDMELKAIDKRIHGIKLYPFGMDEGEWFVPKALQRYGK